MLLFTAKTPTYELHFKKQQQKKKIQLFIYFFQHDRFVWRFLNRNLAVVFASFPSNRRICCPLLLADREGSASVSRLL